MNGQFKNLTYGTTEWFQAFWNMLGIVDRPHAPSKHKSPPGIPGVSDAEMYRPEEMFTGQFVEERFR